MHERQGGKKTVEGESQAADSTVRGTSEPKRQFEAKDKKQEHNA